MRAGGATDGVALDMGGTSCDVCLVLDGEPLYGSDFEIEFGLPGQRPERLHAHDRRRRRLDRLGRPRRLPPGRPAERGRRSRPRLLRARRRGGDDHGRERRPRPPRSRLLPRRAAAARRRPGGGGARPARRRAGPRSRSRSPPRCSASRTRTWRTRSASSPSSRASTRAGSRWWRSAAPGRRTRAEIADAMDMRRVLVPPSPGVCSAFGTLAAPLRVDAVRSVFLTDQRTSAEEVGRPLRRARGGRARGRSRRRAARARSPRCGARSPCATRARTTSRRWRCRPAR